MSPLSQQDGCTEEERAVGRAPCPPWQTALPRQPKPASLGLLLPRSHFPCNGGVPASLHCLHSSVHPVCAHFGGSWVWAYRFSQQQVNPGRAAGDRVTISTVCTADGRSPAKGCNAYAWAGFAENVTLVRNYKT